jgi:GWxTD domain-containing protein
MKKISHHLYLLFALVLGVFSPVFALDLGVSYAVFATPDEPYVEINLEISPQTITWKTVDSLTLQAGAEVLILIKKGDQVVAYEKYALQSPALSNPQILLDVKRLAVPNGDYTLEVSVTDLALPTNTDRYSQAIRVAVSAQVRLAEVQLMRGYRQDTTDSPFTKNGYYMEPLPFAFYDRAATTLVFYTEMYHTNQVVQAPTYTLRYFVERLQANNQSDIIAVGNQKKRPTVIDAALVQMDISKLESGNYRLNVEIRDQVNTLLASQSIDFQRSNPYLEVTETELTDEVLARQFVQDLDEKTLRYSLKAISPMVYYGTEPEALQAILQGSDLKAMRYFLFRYFVRMDPNNPDLAYRKYMETATVVDKQFHSGFRLGFETDRGRTYMRYGRPDDLIRVEDDPAAPPYEIWVYYNFPKTQQRNVKFLFYNPSLAGEDFVVLHSNARGEVQNPRWERQLYRRNANEQYDGENDADADRMLRNSNRNARVYFEDF